MKLSVKALIQIAHIKLLVMPQMAVALFMFGLVQTI